jgi:hypothetical protein
LSASLSQEPYAALGSTQSRTPASCHSASTTHRCTRPASRRA